MPDDVIDALEIVDLSPDGRGVGFINSGPNSRGKAVFVVGALPGQTVACRLLRQKETFAEARAIRALNQDWTPETVCENPCGGCPLRPMPYARQLFWKEKIIRDAFARLGGVSREKFDSVWQGLSPSPRTTNFRNKITFACGSYGEPFAGLREAASHKIVPVKNCQLMSGAGELLAKIKEIIRNSPLDANVWRFIALRALHSSPGRLVLLTVRPGANRRILAETCRNILKIPDVYAAVAEERKTDDLQARGQRRVFCENYLGEKDASFTMPLGGKEFALDAASFFQVNDESAERLASLILEADNGGESLLDLYGGVGAPGLLLAPRYKRGLGIERDPESVRFYKKNASVRDHWNCLTGDVAKIIDREEIRSRRWSTVLLDPPRAGVGKEVLNKVQKLAPERLIYVSCNPVTLARDIKIIGASHKLTRLEAVDMFPHAAGAECLATLEKI